MSPTLKTTARLPAVETMADLVDRDPHGCYHDEAPACLPDPTVYLFKAARDWRPEALEKLLADIGG
jgi:hypothetical protein